MRHDIFLRNSRLEIIKRVAWKSLNEHAIIFMEPPDKSCVCLIDQKLCMMTYPQGHVSFAEACNDMYSYTILRPW
jgi:hypothetical protein